MAQTKSRVLEHEKRPNIKFEAPREEVVTPQIERPRIKSDNQVAKHNSEPWSAESCKSETEHPPLGEEAHK